MPRKANNVDKLFAAAERLANDNSLFPEYADGRKAGNISGLLTPGRVRYQVKRLRSLDVDAYIERTVVPAESNKRPSAPEIVKLLNARMLSSVEDGPLFAAEMAFTTASGPRRIGILAQNRAANNGVWGPQHHLKAVELVRQFAAYNLPIVCLIDTPGADAGEIANRDNQAHSISRLIAEMGQIHVPTMGIVLGNGYSGGAIPLATTNVLLSVRDGVFNTIQPRGLASIARKYDLSWQECAKFVGVSPYELFEQGYLDGVIDYDPMSPEDKVANLQDAIVTGIASIEDTAARFVDNTGEIYDHYRRSVERYLNPDSVQKHGGLTMAESPTSYMNVFGVAYRYLRYLGLRRRISSTSLKRYGRLASAEIPRGDLSDRIREEHAAAFQKWLSAPLEVKYDDALDRAWRTYVGAAGALGNERGRIGRIFLKSRDAAYAEALEELTLNCGFHLYNLWKVGANHNFKALIDDLRELDDTEAALPEDPTVLDVVRHPAVREPFIVESENFILFDLLYNGLIQALPTIALEAKEHNKISRESVGKLLETALEAALKQLGGDGDRLRSQFYPWLRNFVRHYRRGRLIKAVSEWKKIQHPRVSETLFAIISFYFEHLLPNYYASTLHGRRFDGSITPRSIGVKDFWNRVNFAYSDLLINHELHAVKKRRSCTPEAILERFFEDPKPVHDDLMTADPVKFPGFRLSIEQALNKEVTPCGSLTYLARFKSQGVTRQVGVIVSNVTFQAGAWDMASAEKFCHLLGTCARRRMPVVCFISSGGMQTKEGAGSLFSMAIVNDRITRFVRDNNLPVLIFGFGDCTGGAQASFVTHPLVQNYYFSGTNMPFAGQIVVPSHLPLTCTLSNYLSRVPGAMKGLVQHPFEPDLDAQLQAIDPGVPAAKESVEEVITRVLRGHFDTDDGSDDDDEITVVEPRQVKKVLIHARGCTAAKLIRIAQQKGIEVVLVQSDADMDSAPAEQLTDSDHLVCIGGNTPDESYLNARSIMRIAEREGVDSLHPGIGFLSENAQFAALVGTHGVNFIGPPVSSMELMGNKSNAIKTAQRLKVPVVPGSHGIVTSPAAAEAVAEEIGYPVIIKAVHGGGGKGIQVVHDPKRFRELFSRISAEARAAFGSSDCYIERFVTSLRHVELQILRDTHGNCLVLGLRDCSVQRNNQKIVEESDSTLMTEKLRKQLYKCAAAIADDIGYEGAGTVEFIFDLDADSVYFMEMNTRLQVEHPVTEKVTGIDIVGAQYDVASGASIADLKPGADGYAIELRITAEKAEIEPDGGITFIPDPGKITKMELPQPDHIDLICAVKEGKTISPYYDSMIVQVIAHGKDREDTVKKLLAWLDAAVIEGVCTNIAMLKRILADEVFRSGKYDTGFLPKFFQRIDLEEMIKETEENSGTAGQTLDRGAIEIEGTDELKVLAQGAGIFYLTPSPSDPEFAAEGEIVDTEQTLCLVEAMKLFRPINLAFYGELYADHDKYEVVRIGPATGQAVNKGDLLFVIKPA